MEIVKLKVSGMSCQHCVAAVNKAVNTLPGVSRSTVDLASATASIEYDPTAIELVAIKAAIEDQGYDVE